MFFKEEVYKHQSIAGRLYNKEWYVQKVVEGGSPLMRWSTKLCSRGFFWKGILTCCQGPPKNGTNTQRALKVSSLGLVF